jgi:hypothetical protein
LGPSITVHFIGYVGQGIGHGRELGRTGSGQCRGLGRLVDRVGEGWADDMEGDTKGNAGDIAGLCKRQGKVSEGLWQCKG